MYRRRRGRNTLPVVRETRARSVAGISTILLYTFIRLFDRTTPPRWLSLSCVCVCVCVPSFGVIL